MPKPLSCAGTAGSLQPCVPVYDDQGRLVHTNTCMKGTTQDNWETAGAIAGGAAAVAGLTMGIIALSK
ncbi:hypothetical protein [Escherichia coli]|uniref:hypothetical protein n=1 Tax=Escherichia coli TaxID=562 RepID=UPI0037DCFE6F